MPTLNSMYHFIVWWNDNISFPDTNPFNSSVCIYCFFSFMISLQFISLIILHPRTLNSEPAFVFILQNGLSFIWFHSMVKLCAYRRNRLWIVLDSIILLLLFINRSFPLGCPSMFLIKFSIKSDFKICSNIITY